MIREDGRTRWPEKMAREDGQTRRPQKTTRKAGRTRRPYNERAAPAVCRGGPVPCAVTHTEGAGTNLPAFRSCGASLPLSGRAQGAHSARRRVGSRISRQQIQKPEKPWPGMPEPERCKPERCEPEPHRPRKWLCATVPEISAARIPAARISATRISVTRISAGRTSCAAWPQPVQGEKLAGINFSLFRSIPPGLACPGGMEDGKRHRTGWHTGAVRAIPPFCADSPPDVTAAVAVSGCHRSSGAVHGGEGHRQGCSAGKARHRGGPGCAKPAGIALLVAQGNTTPSALFRQRLAEPNRKHAKLVGNGLPCKAHQHYPQPLMQSAPALPTTRAPYP